MVVFIGFQYEYLRLRVLDKTRWYQIQWNGIILRNMVYIE